MIDQREILSRTIDNSHAVIVEIPRGFGFSAAVSRIDFPADAEVIEFLPRIHQGQKTEIINVEDIVEIQQKVRGKSTKKQIIVIHDAGKMNVQAQNKFLKLLEEPRENLSFVLLAESAELFLPTIRSRAQIAKIAPISKAESVEILAGLGRNKPDEAKLAQILFLASGLPGELEKLALDKKYFAQKTETMQIAKQWLSGGKFTRIGVAQTLSKDRQKALDFIELTLQIMQATLNANVAQQYSKDIQKMLACHRAISRNGNIRLAFLAMILA